MANYVRIALPGRWMARLAVLVARQARHEKPAVPDCNDRDRAQDAHPTTMQIIERVSAHYQEKLGFNTLFFSGEFRRMC